MNRISHYFRNQQSNKGRTIYKLNAFVKKNYDKTNFKNCISVTIKYAPKVPKNSCLNHVS